MVSKDKVIEFLKEKEKIKDEFKNLLETKYKGDSKEFFLDHLASSFITDLILADNLEQINKKLGIKSVGIKNKD